MGIDFNGWLQSATEELTVLALVQDVLDKPLSCSKLFCGSMLCEDTHIYIYIYMPESDFLYHFFAFWRVRNSTTLKFLVLLFLHSL